MCKNVCSHYIPSSVAREIFLWVLIIIDNNIGYTF